jgi:hypothetical protein
VGACSDTIEYLETEHECTFLLPLRRDQRLTRTSICTSELKGLG